jgi:single-stranded DNA-binding protein
MSFLLTPARRTAYAAPSFAVRSFSSTRAAALARMTIVGRLGTEPELKESASGKGFIRYVVGTDSGPKDNRTTSWFRVTSFAEGPQREYIAGLQKG